MTNCERSVPSTTTRVPRPPSTWAGIFTIALLLHVLNIAVAAFSPTIHSLRLNLIEFFKQFVEPGGSEYKPFKRTGGV